MSEHDHKPLSTRSDLPVKDEYVDPEPPPPASKDELIAGISQDTLKALRESWGERWESYL